MPNAVENRTNWRRVMEEVAALGSLGPFGIVAQAPSGGKFFRINGQLVKWNEWQTTSGRDLAVSL
jgi:hypothetical protein